MERLGESEAVESPSNSSRAPRSKCGLSQDVFAKMDGGELRGTQLSPAKAIEITSILNGLQGSSTGLAGGAQGACYHGAHTDTPFCLLSF